MGCSVQCTNILIWFSQSKCSGLSQCSLICFCLNMESLLQISSLLAARDPPLSLFQLLWPGLLAQIMATLFWEKVVIYLGNLYLQKSDVCTTLLWEGSESMRIVFALYTTQIQIFQQFQREKLRICFVKQDSKYFDLSLLSPSLLRHLSKPVLISGADLPRELQNIFLLFCFFFQLAFINGDFCPYTWRPLLPTSHMMRAHF